MKIYIRLKFKCSGFTPSTFAPPAPPSFNISNANASSPFGGGFGAKPLDQQPKPAAFGAIGAANFGKRIYPAEDEANKSNKRAMSTGGENLHSIVLSLDNDSALFSVGTRSLGKRF